MVETNNPLRVPPWRLIGSRWFWGALLYLVTTAVLGLVSLVVLFLFPLLPLWLTVLAEAEPYRTKILLPHAEVKPWTRSTWRRVGQNAVRVPPWRSSVLGLLQLLFGSAVFVLIVIWPTLVVSGYRLVSGQGITIVDNDLLLKELSTFWQIIAVLALFVFGIVLIYLTIGTAWLQALITSMLNREQLDELKNQVSRLATKEVSLASAFEQERMRIERELHDGPQQHLSNALIQLGLARTQSEPQRGERLLIVEEQLQEAADSLRSAVAGLRPRVLVEDGLAADIAELTRCSGVPIEFTQAYQIRARAEVESALHFVVSEFLANSYRHSKAQVIQIVLTSDTDELRLLLSDDGVGGADATEGTGLVGIMTRLRLLKADFEFTSPIGGPTQLLITVDNLALEAH